MGVIVLNENMPLKPQKSDFITCGKREREDLQEWIVKYPEMLGEDLLIIGKEFDKFDNTLERLDLLAIDKSGNLVIIENKRDKAPKEIIGQALRYAAYCATLTKEQIIALFQEYLQKNNDSSKPEDLLEEFIEGDEPFEDLILNAEKSIRILLVATEFPLEVTSAVIWLMDYGIDIGCIKVTLHTLQNQIIAEFNKIIPVKDTEDYVIRMGKKDEETIKNQKTYESRIRFWNSLKARDAQLNKTDPLFSSIKASKDSWIVKGLGASGYSLHLSANSKAASVYIVINYDSAELNKIIFDYLLESKTKIEDKLGNLQWDSKEGRKTCQIVKEIQLDCTNQQNWDEAIDFLLKESYQFDKIFRPYAQKIKQIAINFKNNK